MKVHFVKKARKPIKEHDIKVGDSYYWWKFRYGPKRVSKTYPKRQQLTQSGFLQQLYDIEDKVNDIDREDIQSCVEDIMSDIEMLRDECQDNLDNMPEHLQESSSSGELLQERIEGLDEWLSDLDSIDTDVDDDLSEEDKEARIDEIIEEIQATSSGL